MQPRVRWSARDHVFAIGLTRSYLLLDVLFPGFGQRIAR